MHFNCENTGIADNAQLQVFCETQPKAQSKADKARLARFPARFQSKVRFERGCWVWIGASVFPPGHPEHRYGNYSSTGRSSGLVKAHRFAYQFFYKTGVLPGFDVDHICQIKLCVNPRHLRVITHADNCKLRTHSGPRRRSA